MMPREIVRTNSYKKTIFDVRPSELAYRDKANLYEESWVGEIILFREKQSNIFRK